MSTGVTIMKANLTSLPAPDRRLKLAAFVSPPGRWFDTTPPRRLVSQCPRRTNPMFRRTSSFWLGLLTVCGLASGLGRAADEPAPPAPDGVAVVIVFDTSGSMRDPVKQAGGGTAPKYQVATRALRAVVDRLEEFTQAGTPANPRRVEAGLVVFNGNDARYAVPFGPLDARAFRNWADGFKTPDGATPLGRATSLAAGQVLAAPGQRKHVLVITDGENTVGPDPAAQIPGLRRQADRRQTSLAFHFVAFDVDAKVFDPVKKLGANVVRAGDEQQLKDQLQFILERKILLEDEDPPAAHAATPQ